MEKINIKVIAIGNKLMGDDSVGIRVVEKIMNKIKHENIEFIIGETDTEYCIDKINEDDFLIIIDAMYSSNFPGKISLINIHDIYNEKQFYSQHELNLIELLKLYCKNNCGFLIGIEISSIKLSTTLSENLNNSFDTICSNIIKIINSAYMNSMVSYI